ncbi:MAG: hypothetical protein IPN33_25880 [Saprospiraceae bacterium]|nr:hypothetical protein [Saprospiraceae bacterium]
MKKEIEVTVISPYITQRLRELIAQDKDFQRDIEDGCLGICLTTCMTWKTAGKVKNLIERD